MDFAEIELRIIGMMMNNYQELAARTCPADHQHRPDLLPTYYFHDRMIAASAATTALDPYKRAFAYGKPTAFGDEQPSLPPMDPKLTLLLHMVLGIVTEAGELLDAIMPAVFNGEPLDEINIQEELGDIAWYRANALKVLGQTIEQNDQQNIAKLMKRFPDKYDAEMAINRDVAAERQVLETTAELHRVTIFSYGPDHDRARGAIYNDRLGRFPDGEIVNTSRIVSREGDLIRTQSGHLYLLVGDVKDER